MPVTGSLISNPVLRPEEIEIGDGNRIYRKPEVPKRNRKTNRRSDGDYDLFDIIDAPLPVSGEGEYLRLAYDIFKEALESNKSAMGDKSFSLHSIPSDTAQIPYDVMVLVYRTPTNKALLYPFILADSLEREYTHSVYMKQSTREYVVTPDSIYDMSVYDRIKRHLSKSLPNYEFNQIAFLLIPRNFNYENNVSVKKILNNAMNAIHVVINNKVITGKHIEKVGLITKVRFAKDQAITLHERIARSDVSLLLEATKVKHKRRGHRDIVTSDDFVDVNRGLIRCDGFVDLVYAKPRGGYFSCINSSPAKYIPRLVITNLEQKQRTNTMGLTLVALANAFMLQTNRNWALALKRPRGKAMVNSWHDIGAVAYEMNTSDDPEEHDFSKKIATDDPSFNTKELKELVSKTFSNTLLVSLDVEMGGPQLWLQTHFTKAAYTEQDHPEHQKIVAEANRYILEVADQITNGKFSEMTGGKSINAVYSGYERVHLGTYEDQNSELRDIRDICYRAILNNCHNGDLTDVISWANSFDQFTSPEGNRIALREDMIRRMTFGKVKFEAMAKRITFNPAFLQFLAMGLMSEGINMMPIISDGFNSEEDRYFANYARYGHDVDPIKIMLIKQRGIDMDNPSNISMEDVMFLKMLGVNPFENQLEMIMSQFGNKSFRNDHDRTYSCF